jgi:hypothetical protein
MLPIAGHDVVGASGLGALKKNIVIGVGTCMHLLGGLDPNPILPNSAECGLDCRLGAVKFGTPYYFFLLCIDIAADAKLRSRPGERHQKGPGGQALWLQQGGNQYIRVEDDPNHRVEGRLLRRAFRAAAISASISSMES